MLRPLKFAKVDCIGESFGGHAVESHGGFRIIHVVDLIELPDNADTYWQR